MKRVPLGLNVKLEPAFLAKHERELLKTKYVKQPYGENVRNFNGDSCTEAGDRTRGLRHMGQKRNPRVNVKLVRCKPCGSYKTF